MEQHLIKKYRRHVEPETFRLLFDGALSPEKAREISRDTNLDEEIYFYAGVLAKLGVLNGFDGFRKDLIPRLKGLYQHNHVRKVLNRHQYNEYFRRLQEERIDFICGRFLSLEYRYILPGLLPHSCFDLLVHSEDYQRTCKIFPEVAANDSEYVWHTAKETNADGISIKTLSPTTMLLLYCRNILHDIVFNGKSAQTTVTARMNWLCDYKSLDSDAEKIDFSFLRSSSSRTLQFSIRFILTYAYSCYEETEKQRQLNAFFPKSLEYEWFLLKMYGRSLLR